MKQRTGAKVAVAGAGIYGATTAIRLAEQGHRVSLFDPLGILCGASAINACRVHAGYHYPRSPETIAEIAEAKSEFMLEFAPAIAWKSRNFYAIPRVGSRVSADQYEETMRQHRLKLVSCRPSWLNFKFIERCYEVDECLYNPGVLRSLIEDRVRSAGIVFEKRAFPPPGGTCVLTTTSLYGQRMVCAASRYAFRPVKIQVAEKALIELPEMLRGLAVVIIDGPFTAFDSYEESRFSLFGSAKHTNHWSTSDPDEPIPERYRAVLYSPAFDSVPFSHFEQMRADCAEAIPAARDAVYKGSRFAMRVVEDSPAEDRRTLYVRREGPGEFHIFSGKVVSAVKAARLICEAIQHEG